MVSKVRQTNKVKLICWPNWESDFSSREDFTTIRGIVPKGWRREPPAHDCFFFY